MRRCEIITGDCREVLQAAAPFDMLMADPPYGDTSLPWDRIVDGWQERARDLLKPTGSLWVFGSLRYLMREAHKFEAAGWKYAQEIVWEKHNGSGFLADRFKRVHELAVQFYPKGSKWSDVYNEVQKTNDEVRRTVRSKRRPTHMGVIGEHSYLSEDGGPRIMRSVIYARSMHGMAIHPTEKPVSLLEILIRTSCPPGGVVGDLFAGGGSAGEAARNLGRGYVGAEADPEMAAKARDRLASKLALVPLEEGAKRL